MEREADDVVAEHGHELLALPGVVGVGVGGSAEAPTIEVLTERDVELPAQFHGFAVHARRTGGVSRL